MRNKLFAVALSGFLTAGMACGAFAQSTPDNGQQQTQKHGHRQMDPNHQLKHLTRLLDLTADQQNQIKPILEDQDQKLQQLSQDQSLTGKDRHTQRKSITQDANDKINAVLNDQQKQQFAQMQQQKHKHKSDSAQ